MLLVPLFAAVVSALQTLPPTGWQSSTPGGFSIWGVEKNIYIDNRFSWKRDQNGLTLIPPSAYEFAYTFKQDLEEITGDRWRVHTVRNPPKDATGIFLGELDGKDLTYENGEPTEEGYELQVEHDKVTIRGSGSRGMWWGTRTLLQQILLAGQSTIPTGKTLDAPAYPARGFMLDAGRKWYSPEYLKDLCTYASFFKMSEFHYHAADNAPLSRGHNETWQDVYSQWALSPTSPELQPLVQRRNETLSQADFEDFQHHCAQRGVTVIPEIEAPGHCLTITKWKPELALEQKDLLNLTHPDTIPLVKSIWKEYLPWFKTKEVHIGADEYDSTLADDYIKFVNEMAEYIKSISGKRIRIWGTYEPSETETISSDVITQHWQYGQSDPVELANEGYEFINSEDWWAYMSLKNDHMPIVPAPYPPFFNNTRVLNFANKDGWQWEPSLFNPFNVTEQPDAKTVRGAILAAWNDNGPDATTQLEAYYAIRNGIPVVAARSWTGKRGPKLDESTLSSSIDLLTSHAVGQNLDRRITTEKFDEYFPLAQWTKNGKNYGRHFKGDHIGLDSKGMNYTLELEVTGPFMLSSRDDTLTLSHDGTLTFNSDGWEYPLRSVSETAGFDVGFPGRIWTNDTSSTHEVVKVPHNCRITVRTDVIGGSRVWVDGEFVGRFEVFVFGGKNTYFSWSQMAMVVPLERLEGHGLKWLTVHGYDGKHNYTSSD
ncbi:hypothetical protein PHISCL_09221 [Aspergillus sclerotialis]|uniref:beta-N-acetylhexosaminidase n=1 Tax=Aspergillus sclerotialis TaxID=2070753 RepID=A0A3A2Z5T9_9EURO|nr:hypothetical protein PHISCL_09221 [Aspergillus sclerotialis]